MAAPPPFRILDAPIRAHVREGYHRFLSLSWFGALGYLALGWFILNAMFAGMYLSTGGVENMRRGYWRDAFFFSVQTFGGIGYGRMLPVSDAANIVMSIESMSAVVATALATGLLFAKFGRTTARVMFSRSAVITPMEGVNTLMIRVGHERSNHIVDARFEVTLMRTEQTTDGQTWHRMYDLTLERPRTQVLTRSYTLFHAITLDSPLHGYTARRLGEEGVELHASVVGLDNVTLQPVHAHHQYAHDAIHIGARHADVLSEDADGTVVLDLARFHEIEAV